jgi:hypothetical protein
LVTAKRRNRFQDKKQGLWFNRYGSNSPPLAANGSDRTGVNTKLLAAGWFIEINRRKNDFAETIFHLKDHYFLSSPRGRTRIPDIR